MSSETKRKGGGGKRKGRAILDLNKFIDKQIRVKFTGGREVIGVLKGYDQLVNIVLDETVEQLRDPFDPYKLTDETRQLGLTVCRGTSVMLISPVDGMEETSNPFAQEAQPVID
eukprot:TRINITY_DN66423_c4_g13_i1.p2 TRINITY_DN66423_c4_g13~~TRINITY_DN66423_c4_g13_i1.p2  ORF type:complete len:114 (+),score=58.28 TRINITY_DN66423_c4_g13_i1:52-393(+)